MTDEQDDQPEGEDEYLPQPEMLHDEAVLIFDPLEFQAKYNCDAIQYRGGGLFVLDSDSHKWRDVEDFGKPEPVKPKLTRVQ